MKKVLFLQNIGKSYGGVWQVNKMVGEELIKRGYSVSIVSIRNNQNDIKLEYDSKMNVFTINENDSWETYSGTEIKNDLKNNNYKLAIKKIKSRLQYNISLKKDILKLKSYINNSLPDYIVTSQYQLLDMIPKKYLSRTINEQHSSYADAVLHKATLKNLKKYNGKVKFLWLTKNTMEKARKDGFKNSTYIYNATRIRTDKIADVTKNKKLITIARFCTQKRLDMMIDIVEEVFKDKKFNDWIFEMYGDGEERKYIEGLISNKEQIKIMGMTPDPKKELLESSINLNTSLFEGFSLSILEANECGVPTITFDFGESSVEEILNEKTGIIAANREEYIIKLKELMENKDKLKMFSINCKNFSKNFYIETIIEQWIKLFNEVDKGE